MIDSSFKHYDDSVDVTIHSCNFGAEDISYARVQRKTTYTGNVIEKILEESKTFDESTLFHVANLYHNAVIKLLKEGKAVQILDLGIMYLKPEKSMTGSTLSDVPNMVVSFTPSVKAMEAVKDVPVGSDVTTCKDPEIEELINVTEQGSVTFAAKSVIKIKGKNLKVGGDTNQTGIFLVPNSISDFSSINENWIRINDQDIVDNRSPIVEFVFPKELQAGSYRLVIRTSYSGSKVLKTVRTGIYSKPIVVE